LMRAFAALFIVLATPWAAAHSSETPEAVVRRFFRAVNTRQYAKAYSLLGRSIHQDVPYDRFAQEATEVISADLTSLWATERTPYLVKFRVAARIEMIREGQRAIGHYSGRANLHLEQGAWKVIFVELDPNQTQTSGESRPVDFGTR